MTYTLYNRDGSGGFVVEAALTMGGLPFELVSLESTPGSPLAESFRATNPWRQVPALLLPDGTVMTECAAILIYLASAHPEKRLGPGFGEPGYASFLRWMVFTSVNVYEAVLRVGYPGRYTTDNTAQAATREAGIQRMGEALQLLDETAADEGGILGPDLTVLDMYVAMLFIWFRGDLALPRLIRVAAKVRSLPVIAPIWRRHFGDR